VWRFKIDIMILDIRYILIGSFLPQLNFMSISDVLKSIIDE
jgi:hypothetical protein